MSLNSWNFDINTIPRGRTETRQRTMTVKGTAVSGSEIHGRSLKALEVRND